MLRAAAKGRRIVVCDAADRARVLNWLREGRPEDVAFRNELAAKVEMVCARYSSISAGFHSQGSVHGVVGRRVQECRYGENPSQTPAGFFTSGFLSGGVPKRSSAGFFSSGFSSGVLPNKSSTVAGFFSSGSNQSLVPFFPCPRCRQRIQIYSPREDKHSTASG